MEERVGERRSFSRESDTDYRLWISKPALSPALSPFVPHGERENNRRPRANMTTIKNEMRPET